MPSLDHFIRTLLLVTCMAACSCASFRKTDEEEPRTTMSREAQMLNPDLTKRSSLEQKAEQTYEKYTLGETYKTKGYRAKKFDQIKPFNSTNFHSEQYTKKYAKRFQEKKSLFSKLKWGKKNAEEMQFESRMEKMRFPSGDFDTAPYQKANRIPKRSWNPFSKVLNPGDPATGEPKPIDLEGSTMSIGDVKSLLNGP